MSHKKTFEQVVRGSKNIHFNDLISLLEALGFYLDRIEGSHHIFKNDKIKQIVNLQNEKGKAKAYQVRQVARLIKQHHLKLGE